MSLKQKTVFMISIAIALSVGFVPVSNAMHIMEGYLPPMFCIIWGAITLPFLVLGYLSIKKTVNNDRKSITLLAMSGAFIFVISSLKIPSVTGSCSHMTGTGLGAILFGPAAVSILGVIVLLFQAILLAHGGLTSIGANTFSMAIAGPFLTYAVYLICRKFKVGKHMSVFLAAALGDLFTYCITSFQLALAYPSESGGIMVSIAKFLAVFAPTQIPLAIIEGILSVLIIMALETYAKSELKGIGFIKVGEES